MPSTPAPRCPAGPSWAAAPLAVRATDAAAAEQITSITVRVKVNRRTENVRVTGTTAPRSSWAERSLYLKTRDRRSYEFALSSAAVALDLRRGTIAGVRIAVGGMATKPWRLAGVERAPAGKPATAAVFEAAAVGAAEGARTLTHNGFNITLLRRTLVRALTSLAQSRRG